MTSNLRNLILALIGEVPAHSQRRKPDIDPVDIGHETGGEEQRQCPPADAANRLPSRIRSRLFSKRFMVQVMLLWNGAATPEKQIGAMVMRAIGIAGLLLLATATAAPAVTVSADEPKNILATMDRVADWELAHPDTAAVPPSSHKTSDPLDWVVAAFYVGLTALADRSPNPHYGDTVLSLGEQKNWALGPRPFHADDYEVAQSWIWAYQRKHDPKMIATVRQRFDAIVAAQPSSSLLMV